MQKQNPSKGKKSNFLEKFEGKKGIVSRQGLLSLLQKKRKSIVHKNITPSLEMYNQNRKGIKQEEKQIKNIFNRNKHVKQVLMKQHEEQPKSGKLPRIEKSSSHTNSLHKRTDKQMRNINSVQLRSDYSSNINSINIFSKQLNLDKYALKHLQYLNKFQEQLINVMHKKSTVRGTKADHQ